MLFVQLSAAHVHVLLANLVPRPIDVRKKWPLLYVHAFE